MNFHDESQDDIEQRLEVLQVRVPARDQVVLIFAATMNCRFHRCRHEQSQISKLVFKFRHLTFLQTTQLVTEIREDFFNGIHNLRHAGCGSPTQCFLVGFQSFVAVSRNFLNTYTNSLVAVSRNSSEAFVFFPHLRTRYWVWVAVLLQFLATPLHRS